MRRSSVVRQCGAERRENVGMSNRKAGESPAHRKSEVSLAMTIIQGLGGPKVIPKGAADGQLVNIPAHLLTNLKGTESSILCVLLDLRSLHRGVLY